MKQNFVRIDIPDSHGNHIDLPARDAFLKDLKKLAPDEIVWGGDHVDCGGIFSAHQRSYTNEMTESYEDDCEAANEFMNLVQKAVPKATHHYIEGNHEGHVERWIARNFASKRDADKLLEVLGPYKALDLKRRGVLYYKRSEFYQGISIPGTIRLGHCYFTHGITACKHAASVHLARFGGNVVFHHVHRSQSVIERSVSSDGYGAWCAGTLAKLQPLYLHTAPSSWTHGYIVQFVAKSGRFLTVSVPIHKGKSLLPSLKV